MRPLATCKGTCASDSLRKQKKALAFQLVKARALHSNSFHLKGLTFNSKSLQKHKLFTCKQELCKQLLPFILKQLALASNASLLANASFSWLKKARWLQPSKAFKRKAQLKAFSFSFALHSKSISFKSKSFAFL